MRFSLLFAWIAVVCLVSVGYSKQASLKPGPNTVAPSSAAATPLAAPVVEANGVGVAEEPYFAEVLEDNVYVRSGPGTNYYTCGKLKKGDRIKVVGHQYSWSHIVAPEKCFSWVAKQYVNIDPNNPGVGIIAGDDVRVYAGSDERKPMHSWTPHFKLNRNETVRLLGEESEGYVKIAPPEGAYLWVSTQYTKPMEPLGGTVKAISKGEPNAVAVRGQPSAEQRLLREYYDLSKQLTAERAKPIGEQDYTTLKKKFSAIASNKDAGKAAKYSEFALKQIGSSELALEVGKQVKQQDTELQKTQEGIAAARDAKLAEVKNYGKFAVMGRLQISNIYTGTGPKRYLIVDDSGKIICYATPDESAAKTDLSKLIGQKVGLVGVSVSNPQSSGTLVRFTEVVALK